jgi:hypothetical protein
LKINLRYKNELYEGNCFCSTTPKNEFSEEASKIKYPTFSKAVVKAVA